MTQTKLELTTEIINQINTLDNLYCLDLIKRAIEGEIAIKLICSESEELGESIGPSTPAS